MKVTLAILAVIAIAFVLQVAIPGFTEALYFNPASPTPWMFVTSVFLHGGLAHLLFNSFALLMFGFTLEKKLGARAYLALFLLAGIAGNIVYYATILAGIIPPIPALGASGAIYGVLGALSATMPELAVFVSYVPIPIRIATVLWIVTEAAGSFDPNSGIGSAAHLGGLLFGLAAGKYWEARERRQHYGG